MDRKQWLEARRQGIGSSDAAAVCGLCPWRTPVHVYLDKIGALPDKDSDVMEWGLRLEPAIAAAYAERTGRALSAPAMHKHPLCPWMLATADRLAIDRIVELKTARSSEGWGDEGTDEVPHQYLLQVQHQMAVLQMDLADIAVLIGGSDFRIYTVAASATIQTALEIIERQFWQRVEDRRAPEPPWFHKDAARLVDLLHPPRENLGVDLRGDALQWVRSYEEERKRVAEATRLRDHARARVCDLMGDACTGHLPDGRTVRRKQITRKGYSVGELTFTNFFIVKGK